MDHPALFVSSTENTAGPATANLIFQRQLAVPAQAVIVRLIDRRQVPLGNYVGSDQLADVFTEAELAKIPLPEYFMACASDELSVWSNHGGHFAGFWYEATDIVQKRSEDCVIVCTGILRLGGCLQRVLELGNSFAEIVGVALSLDEIKQLMDHIASVVLD